MLQPNVFYSTDWHTNKSGGFFVSIKDYVLSTKTLNVKYLAKDAAVGTQMSLLAVLPIEPIDNEPAIHDLIDAAVLAA